ncbi:MAG: BlaI/MecI/CopY family transcriptional regulator [Lachnospiraceae bacterium]|jgi:BlaI family penicillinase repressor|nr:BlaI/MecI/CopY family transcriptional regulator [Lachnospiraceae bacterium]
MISLSPAEREIMEVIWDSDGMTNNNIVVHFRNLGKEWKRQTTSTFLTRMMQKGLLRKEGHKYMASCTREEFVRRQTREILDDMYGSSLKNFIVALNGGGQMTDQEAEEIRELLDMRGKG